MAKEETTDRAFQLRKLQYRADLRYHSELARMSAWLFFGLIVSMTFLLLAGLRSPKSLLLVFMYVALASLALVMLAQPLINLWSSRVLAGGLSDDKSTAKGAKPAADSMATALSVARVVQQLLFVVGVLAMVGFGAEVASYFFVTAPAATTPTSG